MKKIYLVALLCPLSIMACTSKNSEYAVEGPEEWTVLFDGSNLDQWRGFKKDHVPSVWYIEDSLLICMDSEMRNAEEAETGDIMTREKFQNFELSLEWKISGGGNSGILYFVQETDSSNYSYYTGPEMQVLDNEMAGDNLEKHMAGDLYDLISCSKISVKPVGEWNSVRIVADGSHVEHWLNGVKVIDYDLQSVEMDSLMKNSKWANYPEFGLTTSGHIALQDHGNRVWFRNVKIRSL